MFNLIAIFFDVLTSVISKITSFLLKPIIDFLVENGALNSNWFDTVQTFLNNYFYKGIRFFKEVIINITGIPAGLIAFMGTILALSLGIYVALLAVKFIFNAYSLLRTGFAIRGVNNKL